jgi:hypothetical protein
VEWVALATNIPDNEKMFELHASNDYRAALVYCYSLAYCGRTMSDGFIPKAALGRIEGTSKIATRLVDVGLWKYAANGKGWVIPDWADYQVTSEQFEKRQNDGRKAAEARWSK